MALLTRDAILAADDLETKTVDVPQWGGSVLVKALSGKERSNYLASITEYRPDGSRLNTANMQAKLCARAIVNEDGKRMFSDQDINALGEKSGAALELVFDVVAKMSGLNDEAIEEAAGKSEENPRDDSTSTSPDTSDAPSLNSSLASVPAS